MSDSKTRLVTVFPGQGSQFVGMGRAVIERDVAARRTFEEASDALGYDLATLCLEGPREMLEQTERAQPAVVACSVAIYRALERCLELEPVCAAGHSLGEFSALVCAGAMALSDAVRLVESRARLMRDAAPPESAMAAVVGCPAEAVERACALQAAVFGQVSVANYNSDDQTVISGVGAAVSAVCEVLERTGAVTQRLKISVPCHSPLMQAAVPEFEHALSSLVLAKPRWPVISNASLRPFDGGDSGRSWLSRQLSSPVRWRDVMQRLLLADPRAFLEIGPRSVLRDLVPKSGAAVPVFAFCGAESIDSLRLSLASAGSAGPALDPLARTFMGRALAVAAATRNACFDDDASVRHMLSRHRDMQQTYRRWLDSGSATPTLAQLQHIAGLLRDILRAKRLSEQERRTRFDELFRFSGTVALFAEFEP
jgi:[acyl-carrier-protein] S-malonyltransferase